MAEFYDDPEEGAVHYAERPNKSLLKRESADLEALGEALIALPPERLGSLDLPVKLLEAVQLAQTIAQHHGAFKRQRKFIAKLLRADAEATADIRDKMAGLKAKTAQAIHFQHQVERWRDRLLAGDDHDINAFMEDHPEADRQKLRQLVRDARRERQNEAPPRAARLLFKNLREAMRVDWEEESELED
jgi:ribosome-associated protein